MRKVDIAIIGAGQQGERFMTSNSLFDLDDMPHSVGVIGLGFVGLEMGQALHRLGVRVVGFNTGDKIAAISDPVVAREARTKFSRAFPIHTGHAAKLQMTDNGVTIRVGEVTEHVDKVFVAVGRAPNIPDGLSKFTQMDRDRVPIHDPTTLQVKDLPVFLAGDVV